MKKILLIIAFLFATFPTYADTFEAIPHPVATWDTTNGEAVSLSLPGQPSVSTTLQTLNSPFACGATCSVNIGQIGSVTLMNQAAGSVATLPAATNTGNSYRFMISVLTTSGTEKILTSPVTDAIIGTAVGENGGTAKIFVGNSSTYHSIQMPFSGSQPSGGFIGDSIVCTDVAIGSWMCNIAYQAGTTPTTPYSASTT